MFHTHFPAQPHVGGWYADLCDPVTGCQYTASNIGRCDLFPAAGTQPASGEVAAFATRLPARGTAPTKSNWWGASNGPRNQVPPAPAVCVALGPASTTCPTELVRTQTLDGIFKRYRKQFRGVTSPADLERFIRAHPDGAEGVRPYLGPHATVRSSVRVAFWADKAAVDGFRKVNPSAAGLRHYLGVEDGPYGPGATIVVELRDGARPTTPASRPVGGAMEAPAPLVPTGVTYPRRIPTGFDAGDNAYYLPQPPGSTVGRTQNIVPPGQPGFRHPETDEVVTPEVSFADTRFERDLVY